VKRLTDQYKTDEPHIPNMFESTIQVYYPDCYYDSKFNFYFIIEFFKRPFFEVLQNIQKIAKFIMAIKRSWYLQI
jgi:hypothetical protein